MHAAEYECAIQQTRRTSRLQSQRQEAKSQECLLKRLCRTIQGPVSSPLVCLYLYRAALARRRGRVRKIGL